MKRTKIFVTLSTSILCLALLITGIYAAIKAGFGVNTTMSFITDGVFLEVSGGIYRGEDEHSLEILDGDETYTLYKAQNFLTSDGSSTGNLNIDAWQPNDVYFTPNERTIQFRIKFRNCGTSRMTVIPGDITGLPTGVTAVDDASSILSIGSKEEGTYTLTLTLAASHSTDISQAKFDVTFEAVDTDAKAAEQASFFTGSGTELQGLTSAYTNASTADKRILYIPSTYTSIKAGESYGFGGGSPTLNLTTKTHIIFPEGFTTINQYAFCSAYNLCILHLPSTLTTVGLGAFDHDSSCSFVVHKNNVNFSSSNGHLYNKDKTTLIRGGYIIPQVLDLAEGLKNIGPHAFYGSAVKEIVLPKSVEVIGEAAFYSTRLTDSFLDQISNVTTIGASAFSYCSGFKKMILPSKLTSLGDGFISDAYPTKIFIPASLKNISGSPFSYYGGSGTIYCEAEEKPAGWASTWNYTGASYLTNIVWGATLSDLE